MKNYLTEKGFEKIKKELDYLKTIKRKEISKRLNETASQGDLRENAAYHEAKEAKSFLEGRIKELEEIIKNAKITEKKTGGKAGIGSIVIIDGPDGKEKFEIVGSAIESDPLKGIISAESPLGKVLIGKDKGQIFKIETPGGKTEYKILEIE